MKFPFLKKRENSQEIIKYKFEEIKLKKCPLCKNMPEMTCTASDYFNYRFKIRCKLCNLEFSKCGDKEKPFRPEMFKKDWDEFINSWNQRNGE